MARIFASSFVSERFACLTLMVNACSTSSLMSGVEFCERGGFDVFFEAIEQQGGETVWVEKVREIVAGGILRDPSLRSG
jgi:hypothetical protein